jgi:hypothetical protein
MLQAHMVIAAIALLAASQSARAQGVVQQPVVETFGVDTVVSVPDRGSAFLGGVSTARSGYSTYGPLSLNRAYGFDYGYTYIDVSVFIHDFEAMDQALLAVPTEASLRSHSNAAPAADTQPCPPATRAQAAWRALHKRR